MAHTEPYTITRYLRRMAARREGHGLPDAQLLERFARERDEAAFELLVWRHGPMVLAACRRLLRDSHEAEDAFQATFLALCRRAGAIRRGAAVAGWLYQVACRISLRARAGQLRRSPCAVVDVPGDGGPVDQEMLGGEIRAVLDEELVRLPEKYRVPLVLCYLEGKTAAEVARQLGCPRGTVLSRLQRGRQRLRVRLERRGFALAGAALTSLPALHRASAAVPPALVAITRDTALQFASGGLAAGQIPEKILTWTEEGMHTMNLPRLTLILTVLAALTLGAVLLLEPIQAGKPSTSTTNPVAQNTAPDSKTPGAQVPKAFPVDKEITKVRWSADGKLLASCSTRNKVEQGRTSYHYYCTFKIWNAHTGKETASLGEIVNPGVNAFDFSPDGKFLAVSHRHSIPGGDNIDLYDVEKSALIRTIQAPYGRSRLWFAFSPDGKTIAVPYGGPSNKFGGGARLFDTATGNLKQTLLGHDNIAVSAAFAPDGQTLATSSFTGEVLLWNLAKGQSFRKLSAGNAPILALQFAPDGKTLAASSQDGLLLWEVATGKSRPLPGAATANAISFSRVGTLLATAGSVAKDSKPSGAVHLWNLRTGAMVKTWTDTSPTSIAFAPDGNTLHVLHADKMVRAWDVRSFSRVPAP